MPLITVIVEIKDAVNFLICSGVGNNNFDKVNVYLKYRIQNDVTIKEHVIADDCIMFEENDVCSVEVTKYNYEIPSGNVNYSRAIALCRDTLQYILPFLTKRKSNLKSLEIELLNGYTYLHNAYGVTGFPNDHQIFIKLDITKHHSEMHVLGTLLHELAHALLPDFMKHNNLWLTTLTCLISIVKSSKLIKVKEYEYQTLLGCMTGCNFKAKLF